MNRNSKLAADTFREKAKQQRTHSVDFGVLGVPMPGKRILTTESIDRRPPKHARGFSERYLGREVLKSINPGKSNQSF